MHWFQNVIAVLYALYYVPLFFAIYACVNDDLVLSGVIILTVTSLHFILGGVSLLYGTSLTDRYNKYINVVSDAMLIGAFVCSIIILTESEDQNITFAACILALLGNISCFISHVVQ